MKRLLCYIIAFVALNFAYAQTNPKVKEMESQRNKLEQQLAESRKLLSAAQKDVDGQLAQLSALTAQIKSRSSLWLTLMPT